MSDQLDINSDAIPTSPFERIKQVDPDGNEFWSARDLCTVLQYKTYRKFKNVLLKAQSACQNSGYDSADHFAQAARMVEIGSNAKREVEDMHLSRYACYLVVQNADPSKEEVALGQTYFAVQTHRQEVAKRARVITPDDFAIFQNPMSTLELAANLFRSTQAEDKLRRDDVQGKEAANQVHYQAGIVVRRAIEELGGTMPENLPTAESIKKAEREQKKRLAAKNASE